MRRSKKEASDDARNADKKERGILPKRRILPLVLAVFTLLVMVFFGVCYLAESQAEKTLAERKKEDGSIEWSGDMIGWIEIPDTSINYPVMQTKEDPEYYLHRDLLGNYSFYGTPFLDSRCSLSSDNLIIYGHNINGRRFFGKLQDFRSEDFFKKHRDLIFTTREKAESYRIVSVIETDITSQAYSFTDTYNPESYQTYSTYLLEHTMFSSTEQKELLDIFRSEKAEDIWHSRQFITLSTCRTLEGRSKRLLVVAVKQTENE